jgi:hypothetical protein
VQITIVILLGVLLVVALVAPRTRARSLVPVVCILLGWYWSVSGFVPTLAAAGREISGFLHSLPIRF